MDEATVRGMREILQRPAEVDKRRLDTKRTDPHRVGRPAQIYPPWGRGTEQSLLCELLTELYHTFAHQRDLGLIDQLEFVNLMAVESSVLAFRIREIPSSTWLQI